MQTLRAMNLNNPRAAFRNFVLAAAALIGLTAAAFAPTPVGAEPAPAEIIAVSA